MLLTGDEIMYGFKINRDLPVSNAKQLENQLRDAILSGKLAAGTRILPTRSLAADLGIARNTVIQVYEQLIAEGYLESKEGSGTYVAEVGRLPEYPRPINRIKPVNIKTKTVAMTKSKDVISFNAGNPDINTFPRIQWAKLLKETCLDADSKALTYAGISGHPKLRQAISTYVYRMKGIECDPDQIVITSGASGGMDILAKTLSGHCKKAAIEDPCMDFVKNVFEKLSYEIYPVPVDGQGMDINELRKLDGIDVLYVVPSHQYPIGGVLPAARRVALLSYAGEQNSYIIEDDYDSEYRYKGEVLQALRYLDPERVIYLGSFSKIFTPVLRMGYMILPKHLLEPVWKQIELSNQWVNTLEQLAMAEFINQKLMDKHIYKMRKLYENKRIHVMRCLKEAFGDHIKISGEYAGLHLLISFDRDLSEEDLAKLAIHKVDVDFVEDYSLVKGKHLNQLVMGYGELTKEQIEDGIIRLKAALAYGNIPISL